MVINRSTKFIVLYNRCFEECILSSQYIVSTGSEKKETNKKADRGSRLRNQRNEKNKTAGLDLLQGEKEVEGLFFLGCGKKRSILQSSKELKGNIFVYICVYLYICVYFPTEIQASWCC